MMLMGTVTEMSTGRMANYLMILFSQLPPQLSLPQPKWPSQSATRNLPTGADSSSPQLSAPKCKGIEA